MCRSLAAALLQLMPTVNDSKRGMLRRTPWSCKIRAEEYTSWTVLL